MRSQKNKNFLLLLTGGLVVLLVAVVLNSNKIPSVGNQTTANPTEIEYPVDTENDGLYTNYKYRYRFNYPKEMFPFMRVDGYFHNATFYEERYLPDEDEESWIGQGMRLFTGVGQEKYRQRSIEQFEINRNREDGDLLYPPDHFDNKPKDEWPSFNDIKVENISTNGNPGYIIYKYYTGGGKGVEPSYGYSATWKNGDDVIVVGVYDNNENRKQLQLEVLREIIESMDFLETN